MSDWCHTQNKDVHNSPKIRTRPDPSLKGREVIAEHGAGVEDQLQAELHDFLDVGAGVALGLAGQGVQIERLRLTLAQPQVDAEDLLALGVRGQADAVTNGTSDDERKQRQDQPTYFAPEPHPPVVALETGDG